MQDIGFVALAADILHVGHIRYINKCAKRCKRLIVGVMTDESIREYKGEKPIITYKQRKEILQSIKGVWKTVPQKTFELKKVKGVDVYFDTEEHRREPATVFFKRTEGISSTLIKDNIKRS